MLGFGRWCTVIGDVQLVVLSLGYLAMSSCGAADLPQLD